MKEEYALVYLNDEFCKLHNLSNYVIVPNITPLHTTIAVEQQIINNLHSVGQTDNQPDNVHHLANLFENIPDVKLTPTGTIDVDITPNHLDFIMVEPNQEILIISSTILPEENTRITFSIDIDIEKPKLKPKSVFEDIDADGAADMIFANIVPTIKKAIIDNLYQLEDTEIKCAPKKFIFNPEYRTTLEYKDLIKRKKDDIDTEIHKLIKKINNNV